MDNISRVIGYKFKEFINNQGYDPYEVACLCSQILKENNIDCMTKHMTRINLFDVTKLPELKIKSD